MGQLLNARCLYRIFSYLLVLITGNTKAGKMSEDLSKNKKFLMSAFRGYDKNGDGTVSVAEFTAVMKRVGRLTDARIADMLKKADKDGDGTLSFEEFEMMMA